MNRLSTALIKAKKSGDLWSKPLAWCPTGRLRTLEIGENNKNQFLHGTLQAGCALRDWREQGKTHRVAHRLVSGTPKIPNLKDNMPILIVF
jgi:hypothetical protein